MKILHETILSDGSLARVEDWSEDYTCFAYGDFLAVYPKKYGAMRCQAEYDNYTQALEAFEKLSQGKANIFKVGLTVMRPGGYRVPIDEVIDKDKYEKLTGVKL